MQADKTSVGYLPLSDEDDTASSLLEGLGGLGLDGGEGGDIGLHLKLLSMLDNPAVIVAAAAAGEAKVLRDFLTRHPTEVNAKAAGKTALHCASVGGHLEVVKAVMEFSPDLEVEVCLLFVVVVLLLWW